MANNIISIKFHPCAWKDIQEFVARYLVANQITVDSFWEDHVRESSHYKMICEDEMAGYFSIHGGATIMLFNVFPQYARLSQELFAQLKKYESVTNAMVATGDEFFLSHCADNFSRIEKQAYIAAYTDKEIPTEQKMPLRLRPADIDKDEESLNLCGDFLAGDIRQIRGGFDLLDIYIAELAGETVGFGVIQYGYIIKNIASIGMYVLEEHRRRGIAANILQGLKLIARQKDCRVFSGCWYYNHNSKKSQERAGAFTKTRLLRFYF